jgi:hypothetical protein
MFRDAGFPDDAFESNQALGAELEPIRWDLRVFDTEWSDGESFEWMHARSLAWNLLDNPYVALQPILDNKSISGGVWQSVLDLLAFGQGWVDIARELRNWNYEVIDEPIYSRITKDLGPALVALEFYLNVFPKANQAIAWNLSRFSIYGPETERYVAPADSDYTFALGDFVEKAQIRKRYPITAPLLDVIDLGNLWSNRDADPAHLASHFNYEFINFSDETGVPLPLSATQVGANHFQVSFDTYPRWYESLHEYFSGNHSSRSTSGFMPVDASDLVVDVFVKYKGFIGQFHVDQNRGRFVRKNFNNAVVGHRFGPIRMDLRRLDIPRPPQFEPIKAKEERVIIDSEVSESEAQFTINLRDEVLLAHSLERTFEDASSFRSDGKWHSNLLPSDDPHFKTCLMALVEADEIDLIEPALLQVIDGTLEMNTQSWANHFIAEIWDKTQKFHRVYASISQMPSEKEISLSDFAESDRTYLTTLVRKFEKQVVSSDELMHIGSLLAFSRDEGATAEEILESLVSALDYFGDC